MDRVSALLAAVLAAAVALLEPLTAVAPDTTTTLTAAVVAVALAAVVHAGHVLGLPAPRLALTATATRRRATPVTTDRVTDPVHHPLRPRAPGSC